MVSVLNSVIMPNNVLQAGVRGKQRRSNLRTRNQGGFVDAAVVWTKTLREYELGFLPMRVEQWQAIEGLFEVTDGGAFGFLMEDPKDSRIFNNGALLPSTGGGAFVLAKRYTSAGSSLYRDRAITRPMPAGFTLLRGGVPVAQGSGPGQVTVDFANGTGRAVFTADASRSVLAVAVGATTQVTLSSAIAGLVVSGQLFLQGLTGADATLLNGRYHTIAAIAGAVYTLATNTAGRTITVGAGMALKFPQPDEQLSWMGGFWVPVQFANDEIDWELVASGPPVARLLSGPTINLTEVRE